MKFGSDYNPVLNKQKINTSADIVKLDPSKGEKLSWKLHTAYFF